MSDISTLEKIKESEDSYSKAIEKAKSEADAIIRNAHAQVEIILHDAKERSTEQADSIKVEALKEARKSSEALIKGQQAKVSSLKEIPEDEALEFFAEAVSEYFGIKGNK
jgi:vacuolar-type H+-ATPase subunit H